MTYEAARPWIELYTTPQCPDCIALKRWLRTLGIPFVEHDLRDPMIADEARERTGMRIAPLTLIDGRVFWGTFSHQAPQIADLLGLAAAAA